MSPLTEAECRKWCLEPKAWLWMPTKRSSDLFARIKAATFCDPFRRGRESCDGPGAARALSESGKGFVLLNEGGVFPSGERMHIFERLRLSYGIAEPLIDKCGHELTHQEFEDTSSLVTLAVDGFRALLKRVQKSHKRRSRSERMWYGLSTHCPRTSDCFGRLRAAERCRRLRNTRLTATRCLRLH